VWNDGIKSASKLGFRFPSMECLPLSCVLKSAPTEIIELIADMLIYDPQKRPTAAG